MGFPGSSMVKNQPANAGDTGSILDQEDPPDKKTATLLQYSCLGNRMDREAWRVTVHGVAKQTDSTQQLSNNNNGIIMLHSRN